jgi:ectoine hydroxylase-related dioxygenase (phytanoyl-CoA dioxygenase family)
MPELDFVHYHQQTLPDLLAQGRAELLHHQRLPTLGISIAGQDQSFSYQLDESGIHIHRGTENADLCVELSIADWRGLVTDLETVPSILYGGRLVGHSGNLMNFVLWEPALRALYTGRPLYDPAAFKLTNAVGRALNPNTSFSIDSDLGEMREFLDAAGYLLVKDVFSQAELTQFRAAASELSAAATEGDQLSWWGKNSNGASVLCRALNAGSLAAFSPLYDDVRLQHLAEILPAGMLHPGSNDKDGITVVYKNPDVTEGLSDLPWHRDCGMGGHANMCPTYILSIYLYDATPEQGCLQFLPGSHNYAFGFSDADQSTFPNAVTVPAVAGDITLHIGDVMHAAPSPKSPTGPYRQSVLLAFHPDFNHHRGERHYNDVLLGSEDGQVSHLRDMVDKD